MKTSGPLYTDCQIIFSVKTIIPAEAAVLDF